MKSLSIYGIKGTICKKIYGPTSYYKVRKCGTYLSGASRVNRKTHAQSHKLSKAILLSSSSILHHTMLQPILNAIHPLPVPLFGSVRTASMFLCAKSKALPKMAGWVVPLSTGALWFIWPAVDDGWKIEMGIKSAPKSA